MKLASHNSWSHLPPEKWWMRPFAFIAKCQSKTIREQYEAGVRLFDLRVRFDEEREPVLAHGLMEYPTDGLESDLRFLNNQLDVVIVQVVLELSRYNMRQEIDFTSWCKAMRRKYKNIYFAGYYRKFDWKPLLHCMVNPSIAGKFASAPSSKWYSKLNDLWPWLWTKIHNGKVLKDYADYDGWVMMDFV